MTPTDPCVVNPWAGVLCIECLPAPHDDPGYDTTRRAISAYYWSLHRYRETQVDRYAQEALLGTDASLRYEP